MRKLIVLWIAMIMLVSGCSNTKIDDKENMKNYENFIDTVMTNQGIESKIIPFDYKLNVYKQKDNSYQYELLVSNPRSAMYNVQAIAVNPDVDSNTNVHPCLGLLGEDAQLDFHMVPFQSNAEMGFYKGFSLEGVSDSEQFKLYVMVTWKDSALVNDHRVFFNVSFVQEADDNENGAKETAETNNE
ncbi:hypothetical protein ACWG0P_09135 [Amedibacillus sp. YH-ame6]